MVATGPADARTWMRRRRSPGFVSAETHQERAFSLRSRPFLSPGPPPGQPLAGNSCPGLSTRPRRSASQRQPAPRLETPRGPAKRCSSYSRMMLAVEVAALILVCSIASSASFSRSRGVLESQRKAGYHRGRQALYGRMIATMEPAMENTRREFLKSVSLSAPAAASGALRKNDVEVRRFPAAANPESREKCKK